MADATRRATTRAAAQAAAATNEEDKENTLAAKAALTDDGAGAGPAGKRRTNSADNVMPPPGRKRQALGDASGSHANVQQPPAGAPPKPAAAPAAAPASTLGALGTIARTATAAVTSILQARPPPAVAPQQPQRQQPQPQPQPQQQLQQPQPQPQPQASAVAVHIPTVPTLRTGAAHAVVPDSDGRDSSVGAPSSPDLATSPGPYSDDFMEDELADLEGAVLSERPEDVREYASRVLYYLRDLETRRRPRLNYMMRQREINVGMRAMLIDWLVDVRQEFELSHETLYITVSLIDRFLSLMHVTRARLQLVGVACLLVAAKFEEISPPLVESLVYITDNAFTAREVLMMETQVLRALRFDIASATAHAFAVRFLRFVDANDVVRHLTHYLTDLSLLDYACLNFLPSEIAASAVVLALHTVRRPHWLPGMSQVFGHSLGHLAEECIPQLYTLFRAAPTQSVVAVYHYYSSPARSSVSQLRPLGTDENPLA